MKKIIAAIVAIGLMTASCGTNGLMSGLAGGNTGITSSTTTGGGDILSSLLGGLTGSTTTNSLLNLVIGGVKISESDLYGTWRYVAPSSAFTSENLLAKAGGAVAAGQANEKLKSAYSAVGISSSNTYMSFSQDGQFSGKLAGIPLSGTYTYDTSSSAIKLNILGGIVTTTAYVTRTTNGIGFTFESKKLLSLLQTLTKFSGNSTLSTVGDLSKSFDGIRVGFEMSK